MQFSVQFPEVDRAQRIKHLMAQPEWAALAEELDLRCLKLQIQVFNNDEALSDFRLGKVTGQHAAFKRITQNLAKEMQIRIDKATEESEG